MRFQNRGDAGVRLASRLAAAIERQQLGNIIVLGLPRGGVPVALEVARQLGAPLDVLPVRKLGVPAHPELAMGAIACGGVRVLSQSLIEELRIPPVAIEEATARERLELERRERTYRGNRPQADLRDRLVILVDDGLATGATMEAAVAAARAQGPARVIVAAPVAARETCDRLREIADDVVCLETPEPFHAVGLWYVNFDQISDEEVAGLLET